MTNKKQLIFIIFLILIVFSLAQNTMAQAEESKDTNIYFTPQVGIGEEFKVGEEKQVSGATLATYLISIYNWALRAIVILAIVMIMVAGFRWTTAGGNAALVSQARDQITSSLIGLLIAIGSYALLNFINPSLVRFKSLNLETIKEIPSFRNCGECYKGQICVVKTKGDIEGDCVNNKKVWMKIVKDTKEIDLETKSKGSCGIILSSFAGTPSHIGSECGEGEICTIVDNIYSKENPLIEPNVFSPVPPDFYYQGAECIRGTTSLCPEKKTKEECEYDEKGNRIACVWFGPEGQEKCVDQACGSVWKGEDGPPCRGNCGYIKGIGAIPTDGIEPEQCQDASPALTQFLICMNSPVNKEEVGLKEWKFVITSISDDAGLRKCRDSWNDPDCAHEKQSGHYGKNKTGTNFYGSYAVDFRCMYDKKGGTGKGNEQLPKDTFEDLFKACNGGYFKNECKKSDEPNRHYHVEIPFDYLAPGSW